MRKLFSGFNKGFENLIYDTSYSMKDRCFVIFAFCIYLSLFVSIVSGIITGEPVHSILIAVAGGILYGIYVYIELRHRKLKRVRIFSCLLLCWVIMPYMFFTKGGIYGGVPIAMMVNGYFMIMILEGRLQKILCGLNGLTVIVLWVVSWIRPEVAPRKPEDFNFGCGLAQFILAALQLTIMVAFQTSLLKRETQEAEDKTREMEELNRSQNRFFASMSHEIRTPINTVLGLNEIILRQEDASDEIRRDARNIQGAGKMLLALINDILDVSKIEAGKMDIVPVNYNVGSLMSEIVNMIWLKAEEKGLQFRVDVDPGMPEILFGDEVRIKQILINLLNNAVKYTKEGSVSLHMECEFPSEEIALLKISVEDTGMGIRQEALPHLFDSFQRVDEEKNRHIEGTGLGLSLVKQLVELMNGEITVSSVYTKGSIFNVTLKQGIASKKRIGDLSISGGGRSTGTDKFEHSFHAPDARILIVDDNEMNLQVEKKLLDGTDMKVDLALSGMEALNLTLRHRYDMIFMDHLMPEMDGIVCFGQIRTQKGGLNNNVPVIVLTANAGGENIDLYNQSGFDGYLVKPVSGEQLENTLIAHLPADKVIRNMLDEMTGSQMSTASGYTKKRPVAVLASSVCDLPESVCRELQIEIVPYTVTTQEGAFFDNLDIDSEELLRYMGEEHRMVTSDPPSPDTLVRFFTDQLQKAHQLVFITMTPSSSRELDFVTRAAGTFENVTIFNSEVLSSATGILVMIAAKLAKQNQPVDRIIAELEEAKKRIRCSFIVKSTDVMARRGQISLFVSNILNTLWLRPVLRTKNGRLGVSRFYVGSEERCYEKYIRHEFSQKAHPDKGFVFVTYAGLSEENLVWIEKMIRERGGFEHIIFQKASAGITSNCGEGTFGCLYLEDGGPGYNLAPIFAKIEEEEERYEAELAALVEAEKAEADRDGDADAPAGEAENNAVTDEEPEVPAEKKWYEEIAGIDPRAALKNSGSEEAFLSVLKIYHDSFEAKSGEIQGYYEAQDWENYTIKVHALKSGSRLVGAMQVGEDAEALEMAGKRSDIDFIREHHDALLAEYRDIHDALAGQFGAGEKELPEIPADTLEEAYAALKEFSHARDYELAGMVMDSVREYRLPEADEECLKKIGTLLSQMDWDGILEILEQE